MFYRNIIESNVDANSHISLLGELAKSWNEEHSKYSTTDILLFSNRKKGKRIAHAGPQSSIKRPALNWFIDDLSKQLETVKKYNELVFPGYELAWEEWKKQLEYIPNDDTISREAISTPSLNISTEKITRISPFFNLRIASLRSSAYAPFSPLYTAADAIPLWQNSFAMSSACCLEQQNPIAREERYFR